MQEYLKIPRIEPRNPKISDLVADIEKGAIRLPKFQRNFVWTPEKAASLVDSILKGFPIGSIIFWKTDEELKHVRDLGNIVPKDLGEYDIKRYVLDGQQRLTSLLASLRGLTVHLQDGSSLDFSTIYIDFDQFNDDLTQQTGEPICQYFTKNALDANPLPSHYFLLSDIMKLELDKLPNGVPAKKLVNCKTKIDGYIIQATELEEAKIDIATDIFTRLNVGGKPLTVFEVMVAKTYSENESFDLSDRWDEMLEALEKAGFGELSPILMLQLISIIIEGNCKGKTILGLKRTKFISEWDNARKAFEHAVEYVQAHYGIVATRLLPYQSMLVPIAYFFYQKSKGKPNKKQQREINRWFWSAAILGRYSHSAESSLGYDATIMKNIYEGDEVKYPLELRGADREIGVDRLIEVEFRSSDAFSKTILAILAQQKPLSFDTGAAVNLKDNWLQRANSVNFHHIFPKAYLEKQGFSLEKANSVVNISLVDDYLNKVKIRAKAPSAYFEEFHEGYSADERPSFAEVMNSHLISNAEDEKCPIWTDDFNEFLKLRANLIHKKLRSWLI